MTKRAWEKGTAAANVPKLKTLVAEIQRNLDTMNVTGQRIQRAVSA